MRSVFPVVLYSVWILAVPCVMSGCVAPFRDADIDLRTLTQPDPLPTPPPVLPPPLDAPVRSPAAPTTWRAWVPRQVTANGDVTAGHWLDVSPQGPAVELVEPDKPMPRVPRTSVSKPVTSPPPGGAAPPLAPPPPPAHSPASWGPPGSPIPPRSLPPGLHGGE